MERPKLDKTLDGKTFKSFYYLKEELERFCRENGLCASGGKKELTERIAYYLDTGEILKPVRKPPKKKLETLELTLETIIEPDFVCSETHREFFRGQLGKGFSFNVEFQNWLKSNTGKTYADAVKAYGDIMQKKKTCKTVIGSQFEYNAYIRAFFAANPGKPLAQAIMCWKYKKSLAGHNRYEDADLCALNQTE